MIDQAADQLLPTSRNASNNSLHPTPPPMTNPLHSIPNTSSKLPKTLRVGVWNCQGGIHDKLPELTTLFSLGKLDLLILNETFRRPNASWPSFFPPILAESTNSAPTDSRGSAGVAILANPDPETRRRISSFSLLEQPSSDGTRVCLKVNNLIILAV